MSTEIDALKIVLAMATGYATEYVCHEALQQAGDIEAGQALQLAAIERVEALIEAAGAGEKNPTQHAEDFLRAHGCMPVFMFSADTIQDEIDHQTKKIGLDPIVVDADLMFECLQEQVEKAFDQNGELATAHDTLLRETALEVLNRTLEDPE